MPTGEWYFDSETNQSFTNYSDCYTPVDTHIDVDHNRNDSYTVIRVSKLGMDINIR